MKVKDIITTEIHQKYSEITDIREKANKETNKKLSDIEKILWDVFKNQMQPIVLQETRKTSTHGYIIFDPKTITNIEAVSYADHVVITFSSEYVVNYNKDGGFNELNVIESNTELREIVDFGYGQIHFSNYREVEDLTVEKIQKAIEDNKFTKDSFGNYLYKDCPVAIKSDDNFLKGTLRSYDKKTKYFTIELMNGEKVERLGNNILRLKE